MPIRPKGLPKSDISVISFAELYARYNVRIADADSSAGTIAPPAPWRLPSGKAIDETNAGTLAYMLGDRFGFFVHDATLNRYTVLTGKTDNMSAWPLVQENQFYMPEDCIGIIREYITLTLTFEDVAKAVEKGRGSNYDAVMKFAGNKARTKALSDYRAKMRGRQYPLKVGERFDWLADMIERKQITAAQLKLAYELAADTEATEQGTELPYNVNMEKARRAFVQADSGVDPE